MICKKLRVKALLIKGIYVYLFVGIKDAKPLVIMTPEERANSLESRFSKTHHLKQLEGLSISWEHLPLMRKNIDSRIEAVKEEIKSRKTHTSL